MCGSDIDLGFDLTSVYSKRTRTDYVVVGGPKGPVRLTESGGQDMTRALAADMRDVVLRPGERLMTRIVTVEATGWTEV